jgi:hypothetical protein
MANDAQRKAAKAARRKAVVAAKKQAEAQPVSLADKVRRAAAGPVVRCVMPADLYEGGIGVVAIARSLDNGLLGCGIFMVDVLCLGVKDAFYREMTRDDLEAQLAATSFSNMAEADPAHARKLLRDAAAFAARHGLAPAREYGILEGIFGDIDPAACAESFTFGRDGKPFYIPGPSDSPARIRTIVKTLERHRGAEVEDAAGG